MILAMCVTRCIVETVFARVRATLKPARMTAETASARTLQIARLDKYVIATKVMLSLLPTATSTLENAKSMPIGKVVLKQSAEQTMIVIERAARVVLDSFAVGRHASVIVMNGAKIRLVPSGRAIMVPKLTQQTDAIVAI